MTVGKGKRLRAAREKAPIAARNLERDLVDGWAVGPHIRIRQAAAPDLSAIAQLVPLAGVKLEDALAEAVSSGVSGAALRAGLRGGSEAFAMHMAEQFVTQDARQAYLNASLVLVAEHRDRGVIGTLVAYPPSNVVNIHLRGRQGKDTVSAKEQQQILMLGAVGLSKVKAVAVQESERRHGVGEAMLKRCTQVYFHCGYMLVYGQMPPTPGLHVFYRRAGFQVLQPGEPLDLWVIFGVHSEIHPGPDERMFIRDRL
ncbi:UNVERIFIED_ORG: GNAT superfamily N-acetyltransferase [Microbispora rosea subsp. rosea]